MDAKYFQAVKSSFSNPSSPPAATIIKTSILRKYSAKNARIPINIPNRLTPSPVTNTAEPNTTERFRITPTTAEVTSDNARLRRTFPCNLSMYGAPEKTNKNEGKKVAKVTSSAQAAAYTAWSWPPVFCQPVMKPMNCSTMISGPGVVSASARPSTACAAEIQPAPTAAWLT